MYFYRRVHVSPSNSDLLQRTLQESERLRISIILTFVSVLAAVYLFRGSAASTAAHGYVVAALLSIGLIDVVLFLRLQHARRVGGRISGRAWYISLLVEMLVPVLCITFLSGSTVPPEYVLLANPWVLLLLPVITLSTLRLDPLLSAFGGFSAATLYLAAATFHGWRPPVNGGSATAAQVGVEFYALILFCGGLISAVVANQIRKHVLAAIAEVSAREKLEREMEVARSIQQSLLPATGPSFAGFDIAGWNRPADATGGDFFDWHKDADGRMFIVLADVTGHGIGPALLATLSRAYFRASLDPHDSLASTVQRLNRLLASDLTPPHFVTLVAVACNGENGRVDLFSAGQGPLFKYSSRTHTVSELPPHSLPLGLLPSLPPAEPTVLVMDADDVVVLLTDGFIEWADQTGEQFGVERLRRVLERGHGLNAMALIKEIYREVAEFSGGTEQADDLTAVVIRRVPILPRRGVLRDTLRESSLQEQLVFNSV